MKNVDLLIRIINQYFFTYSSKNFFSAFPAMCQLPEKLFFSVFVRNARCSTGNDKLDKSIGIFSLPSIFSCAKNFIFNRVNNCFKCYANKFEKMYPNVRIYRLVNYVLAYKYTDILENILITWIQKNMKKLTAFRVHESGDFFSLKYLDMWIRIFKAFPTLKFYGYSKNVDALKILDKENLKNVNFISSILPNGESNFGTIEYCVLTQIEYAQKGIHIPICISTIYSRNEKLNKKGFLPKLQVRKVICGKHCKKCQNEKLMLFVIH